LRADRPVFLSLSRFFAKPSPVDDFVSILNADGTEKSARCKAHRRRKAQGAGRTAKAEQE
jgi:hypothetical protein